MFSCLLLEPLKQRNHLLFSLVLHSVLISEVQVLLALSLYHKYLQNECRGGRDIIRCLLGAKRGTFITSNPNDVRG